MKRFAALFEALDQTTSTQAKVSAMVSYFEWAPAEDAAWAVYFLSGGKPRQVVPTRVLKQHACRYAGIDDWLFEECYQAVGDLAETIAHLLPAPVGHRDEGLADWVKALQQLRGLDDSTLGDTLDGYWAGLPTRERFLLIKLMGGGFRVGVSRLLVTRALGLVAGLDSKIIAQRLMGYTDSRRTVSGADYQALIQAAGPGDSMQQSTAPYPFFLAHALHEQVQKPDQLGPLQDWMVEWKYDGIRAQIVKRAGSVAIWSRGEELITERFPELAQMASTWLDGTVLDGEILVWLNNAPADFALLQTRITRKLVSKKILEQVPVIFMAYDMLESSGRDIRSGSQTLRRQALLEWLDAWRHSRAVEPEATRLQLSPLVNATDWVQLTEHRSQSRALGVEGLMLKRSDARYGVGRTKDQGLWLKWKVDPMSVDCVLIYAQRGHGRRASLYTDYTFAVWDRAPVSEQQAAEVVQAIANKEPVELTAARGLPRLVPFAKAYSGLSDEEFKQVDAVIKKTTLDKFGPVRSVVPSLVFELGFEAIAKSPRHKSGLAVRFPRMLRIRTDKALHEADGLPALHALMHWRGPDHIEASADGQTEATE